LFLFAYPILLDTTVNGEYLHGSATHEMTHSTVDQASVRYDTTQHVLRAPEGWQFASLIYRMEPKQTK